MFVLAEEEKGADHIHDATYRCNTQDITIDTTGALARDLNGRYHFFTLTVITPTSDQPPFLSFEPCPDHTACIAILVNVESEPLYARK